MVTTVTITSTRKALYPPMDPKTCLSCRIQHFEDYDLCHYCSEQKQYELEQRLRVDDGKASLMIMASRALFGERKRPQARWRIG